MGLKELKKVGVFDLPEVTERISHLASELLESVEARNCMKVWKAIVDFVDKAGIDPNSRSKNGEPFIVIAARKNCLAVVSYLLEHRADPNLPDERGFTALMWAVLNDNADMVEELLMKGANKHQKTRSGVSAVDLVRGEKVEKILSNF